MQTRRLGNLTEVELYDGLVGVFDVGFVLQELILDEVGVIAPIRYGGQHRIGDVSDTSQTGDLQREIGGRNIHAHPADHDRHQLLLAKMQTKIVYAFHYHPYMTLE